VRAFVESHTPELATLGLVVRSADEKLVVGVGERLIVRVARSETAAREMARERAVAALLSGSSCLRLPVFVAAEDTIDAYRMVPGEPLTPTLYRSLGRTRQRDVGERLAAFLVALHRADLRAAQSEVPVASCQEPRAAAELREHLLRLVTGEVRAAAAHLIDLYAAVERPDSPGVLLHGDMHGWNLAFSKEAGELVGVFDFGSACVGDRHLDFRYLASWQPTFLLDTGRAYNTLAPGGLSPERCLALNVANDLSDVVAYSKAGREVRGGGIERRIRRLANVAARWPHAAW
jgi:aminoglycoside phosphotransferase (APT) family kinase protein